MKRLITICLVAALILTVSGVAQAGPTEWLTMNISGVIEAPAKTAEAGDWMQVGPIGSNDTTTDPFAWGTITSYSATSGLPQNSGDLWAYGWSMQGTIDSIVGYVISSSGTGYMMAPDYNFDDEDEYLEKFSWTMAADYGGDWSSAVVTGTVWAEAGGRQPINDDNVTWPVSVNWYAGSPGILTGTFTSSDNTLTATVTTIPVPGAILLGSIGVGLVGWLRRRRTL